MLALEPDDGIWVVGRAPTRWQPLEILRRTTSIGVCNWLVAGDSRRRLCKACRHNVTVPDPRHPAHVDLWRSMEIAKQRMIYTALRLACRSYTATRTTGGPGLRLPAETPGEQHVMTGHDDGLITIALVEATTPSGRSAGRRWASPTARCSAISATRSATGTGTGWCATAVRWTHAGRSSATTTVDYGEALQRHYANGPKPNWQDEYVSSYAGAACLGGLRRDLGALPPHRRYAGDGPLLGRFVNPRVKESGLLRRRSISTCSPKCATITEITEAWLALSAALNSFNRSMGHQDLYPFVLSETVMASSASSTISSMAGPGRGADLRQRHGRIARGSLTPDRCLPKRPRNALAEEGLVDGT